MTAAALDELDHHEIVDGALVQKAAPRLSHGKAQFNLAVELGSFRGKSGESSGWVFATAAEIELEPHEVYLPDLVGWRIDRVPELPTDRPVDVAPDWVCEILSPSTAARDLGHKRRTYHRARVGQYWVLEPENQTLTVYRWQEDGYLPMLRASAGDVVRAEPFDAIELDVASIFGLAAPRR